MQIDRLLNTKSNIEINAQDIAKLNAEIKLLEQQKKKGATAKIDKLQIKQERLLKKQNLEERCLSIKLEDEQTKEIRKSKGKKII